MALETLVLVLILGLLLRLLATTRPDSDQWGVAMRIENQRRHRWIRYELPDSVTDGYLAYPQLVHFIASRFPRERGSIVAFGFTVLPDLILGVAVYVAVSWMLAGEGLADERGEYASLATLLFLTMPILMPGNARTGATNGRALGLFVATAYFLCVGAALQGAGLLWLIPASAIAMIVFLISFFGMQTVVFFSIMLSLFSGSLIPIVPMALAVGIGLASPDLGLRAVLIGKVSHFRWYLRNKEGTRPGRRNLIRNALEIPRALRTDWTRFRALVLSDAPLVIAAYSLPPAWLLLSLSRSEGFAAVVGSSPALSFCLLMIACSSLLFLLTSTGPGTVCGEAERYFEYSSPMLCVATVVVGARLGVVSANHLLLLVLLQGCIIAALYIIKDSTFGDRMRLGLTPSGDLLELVKFLKDLPGEVRVATVPIKLPDLLSVHTSDEAVPRIKYYHRLLTDPRNVLGGFKDFEEDAEDLHCFRGTPDELARKYDLNKIVVDRRVTSKHPGEFVRELSRLEPSFCNRKYAVYDVGVERAESGCESRTGSTHSGMISASTSSTSP